MRFQMKNDWLNQVEGWLIPEALNFVEFYSRQHLSSLDYESMEIGVHHGKFFIGLERLTPSKAKSYAVDIFEQQYLNIDQSGRGDSDIFQANVAKYCASAERVQVVCADSFDCRHLLPCSPTFGLISIDGGHTVDHTVNDLSIAHDLLMPEGLVILDDITNPGWPGVVEGAVKFLSSPAFPRIRPLALGFNKLFFVHNSNHSRCLKSLINHESGLSSYGIKIVKLSKFCSSDVAILGKT